MCELNIAKGFAELSKCRASMRANIGTDLILGARASGQALNPAILRLQRAPRARSGMTTPASKPAPVPSPLLFNGSACAGRLGAGDSRPALLLRRANHDFGHRNCDRPGIESVMLCSLSLPITCSAPPKVSLASF